MTKNIFINRIKASLLLISFFMLGACSNEETYKGFDSTISLATPDKYFQFFNQQSKLAAGFYTVVAATKNSGESGEFTLTIKKNDGSETQTINDSWGNSVGTTTTPWTSCAGNKCIDLELAEASGVTITLTSALDNVLYLVNKHDSPVILKTQDSNAVGIGETIEFSIGQIREVAYADAYYAAVDSKNLRTTLQDYKALHGFNATDEVHVTFRDSKDLGYGRDMYMRSYHSNDCGGQQVTAFYVRNFKVDVVKGFSYGLVNLEAANEQDLNYHFGSNAIEFSKGFDSLGETCADEAYTRFFTFKSDYTSSNAPHPRLSEIDLDGRGLKAMPQPCISCHGGKARPLDRFNRFVPANANDSANQIGDTKSRLQAFEVDTFEYSDDPSQSRENLEEKLRQLNNAVLCTYPGSKLNLTDTPTDNDIERCADFGGGIAEQTDNGEWNGDFARDVLVGNYSSKIQTAGTIFNENYVPDGWKPVAGSIPEGADTLFKKVISPNCFVCHGKRGSGLGSGSTGKDLDFSTYAKFISHSEEIRRLVFEEGRMPLGLLNFNNFWGDKEKGELLASFISANVTDFSRYIDANQNIIKPGLAVARAGLDRVTQPNKTITLNANSSLFVDGYTWEIVSSPAGSLPVISSANNKMTSFTADLDGTYNLKLTVTNSSTTSQDTDEISVVIDTGLAKAPRDLIFGDIKTIVAAECVTCHIGNSVDTTPSDGFDDNGLVAGIPAWWEDDQPALVPSNVTDAPLLGFYEQFHTRINLNDIEDSLVLKKPSNHHHNGGLRSGFDTSKTVGANDRARFDLFVNWISEGAVCGVVNSTDCPTEE